MCKLRMSVWTACFLALLAAAGSVRADFIPTDVSGCRLWLDSSDPTTLYKDAGFTQPVMADGDRIGGWKDKSGNSVNVVQANLANEPTYKANSLYGLPTVAFTDLSQTVLRSPTGNTTGITGNADRTVFAVWSNWVDNNQNYQHVFHMGTNVNWDTYGIGAEVGGANPRRIGNHYWGNNYQTSALTTANPTMAMASYDHLASANGTDSWYVNGVNVGNNVLGTVLNTGTVDLSVGARIAAGAATTEGLRGNIAEILVYNRVLTAAEQAKVGYYLASQWGISTPYSWPVTGTLTWNKAGGDAWATANWAGGPPASPTEDYAAVINGAYTVTVPAAGADAVAANLALSGNASVAVGAGRTLIARNAITAGAGSSVTLGPGAGLFAGQASSIASLLTTGDSTVRNLSTLTLGSLDNQGIPGTMQVYGPGALTIAGATLGSVSVEGTNFLVNPGATLGVAGRVLLGGDPLVTLNGGTLAVTPGSANPSYPNAYMMDTAVNVSASSTVTMNGTGTLALGVLRFLNACTLTTSGSGPVEFLGTTLGAAGTTTFNVQARTVAGSLDAEGRTATLAVTGTSSLIFQHPGANLQNTTFQVQSGASLGFVGPDRSGGRPIQIAGGTAVLGSPDGSNQTYGNAITSTASGALVAGASGIGVSSGDITVTNLALGANTTVDLSAQGSHRLVLPNPIAAPTASLSVSAGQVVAASPVSLNNLTLTGGTTTLSANTTLAGGLYGSGALVTQGTLTINAQAGFSLSGSLNVASGNLTINAPASAIPSGALARWSFDNAANLGLDSMGNYNGTLSASPPTQTAGKIGGALNLTTAGGLQQYITLPAGFSNFSTGMTLSGWMYYTAASGSWCRMFDFGTGAGANDIYVARNGTSTNLSFDIFNATTDQGIQTVNGALPTGQWLMVTETLTPGSPNPSNVYINGVLVSTKTYANLPALITRTSNYIGKSNWNDGYMNGYLDELTVYDRPLSQNQITALYQAGQAGSYTATVGDVRLAAGTSLTLAGGGTAAANSLSVTGGPSIAGPMTLSNAGSPTAAASASGNTLTLDATVTNAQNFLVNGAGTLALKQSVTIASGGTFAVNPGATLTTQGIMTIDISAGKIAMAGTNLNVAAGALTITMPATATGVLPSGAVAYYTFNNANNLGQDSSGKGNDLTAVGSPAYSGLGAIGGALNVSGGSRLTAAIFPSGVPTGNSAYTISAWVNPNAGPGNWGVVGWGNYGTTNQANALRTNGATNMYNYWWNNDLNAPAGFDLTTGAPPAGWHLVVATYDPAVTTRTVYIDGVVAAQQTNATGLNAQALNFNIGATGTALGEIFNGYVDEVMIYNRALSAGEVTGLYQAGAGGGFASLGRVTMAAGTSLTVNGAAATLESLTTLGPSTTLTGAFTTTGPVTIGSSPGTLSVVGSFAMGAGSSYTWETQGTAASDHDLIAVSGTSGNLDISSAWTLAVTPLKAFHTAANYDVFTYTGSLTGTAPFSNVTLTRNGAYGDLIDTNPANTYLTTIAGSPNRVALHMTMNSFTQWPGVGTSDWNASGNWDNGLPTTGNAAVVNASGQVATVNALMPTQTTNTLIVDTGGAVLVDNGGNLQVTGNAWVQPTGKLTVFGTLGASQLNTAGATIFGPDAALNVSNINVTGGTTTGTASPNPGKVGTTLGTGTTLTLAGGTLAGPFTSLNTSTTPGSYAFEIQSGATAYNAVLQGATASLHVPSTAGTSTIGGPVYLNTMSVEGGTTTLADNDTLKLNALTVSGGSLNLNRPAQLGSVSVGSGATLTATRGMNVTGGLGGSGTLIADGSQVLDLSTATAASFTGELRVLSSSPANSGDLLIRVPATAFPFGAIAHFTFDNAANLGQDSTGNYNGTLRSFNGGALATQVAGRIGGAISLSQPNQDYVQLPSGMADFSQGMTLSGWVYYTSVNNWARIFDFGNGSASNNILLARNGTSNDLTFEIYNGTGSAGKHTATGVLPTGQWIYVAETLTPGTGGTASTSRLYVNGALIANTVNYAAGLPQNITRTLNYIGKSNWGDDYLNGYLDDLFVYNRPLSTSEVQSLYQGGLTGGNYGLPSLGNLTLGAASRAGLNSSGTAQFTSIGALGGITVTGPVVLGGPDPSARSDNAQSLTINGTLAAANFNVTGSGNITLKNNLTVASGGTLSVPSGASLTAGAVTIDASSAVVSYKGGLNVPAGSVLTLSAPNTIPLPPGAVARYTFDDPTNLGKDTSGNGYNLASVGAPAYSAQGEMGGALSLNGASRLTAATFPALVPTGGSAYTISAWVNPNAGPGNWGVVGWGNWNNTDQCNALRTNGATAMYNYWWGDDLNGPAGFDLTTGSPPAGWHYVVATYDPTLGSNQNKIYIDNVLVAQRTKTTINSQPVNFNIGATGINLAEVFNGTLDDVQIYSRALTSFEVSNSFSAGLQGGYGAARFGDLSLGPGAQLRITGSGSAGFTSIVSGNGASITGNAVVDGLLDPTGKLTVSGDFEVNDGATYKFDLSSTSTDLVEANRILLDGGIILSLTGAGLSVSPTDMIELFRFDSQNGLLVNVGGQMVSYTDPTSTPIQAMLRCSVEDPFNTYAWDASNARFIVEGQSLYLTGVEAMAVPEPATLALLGLGALALLRRRRGARKA